MSNASSKNPTSDIRHPTSGLGGPARALIVTLLIFIFSQFLAALLVALGMSLLQNEAHPSIEQSTAAQFIFILLAEAIAVGFVLLILRRRQLGLAAIGLGRKFRFADILWAAIGFIVYYALVIVALILISIFVSGFDVNAPQDVGFKTLNTSTDHFLAFLALVILPPLGEETLMRGYLYSALRARWKFLPTLLVTSLLFGIAHLSTGLDGALWAAGATTFILAVVLVYLRERTGALYACFIVHALNNMLAFLVHFYG